VKRNPIKTLQNKVHKLWWKYCYNRDGGICQVKKYYPFVKIAHSNIIQIDHCFERGCKALFVEVANGTTVCSTCNMLKGKGIGAVDRLIDDIVKRREGKDKFNEMLKIALSMKPFIEWRNISWLENKIKELEHNPSAMVGKKGNI